MGNSTITHREFNYNNNKSSCSLWSIEYNERPKGKGGGGGKTWGELLNSTLYVES